MGAGVLQTFCKAYSQQVQSPALISQGPKSQQLNLLQCKLTNKSGGASDLGIARGLGNANWGFSSVVGGVATDDSALIQAGSVSQLFSTTANDGYAVSSHSQFGVVGFTISQGQAGAPAYTYKYWNGAAWTVLPTILKLNNYAAGYAMVVTFLPPIDWAKGGTGGITGLDQSKYHILVQATTAPTQAVLATGAVVGVFIDYAFSVPNLGTLSWPQVMTRLDRSLLFDSGDYILPFFATANAENLVSGAFLVDY